MEGGMMQAKLVNKGYKKNGSRDGEARAFVVPKRDGGRTAGGDRNAELNGARNCRFLACEKLARPPATTTTTTTTLPSAANRSEIYRRKTTSVFSTNSTSLRFNYVFLPGRVIDIKWMRGKRCCLDIKDQSDIPCRYAFQLCRRKLPIPTQVSKSDTSLFLRN